MTNLKAFVFNERMISMQDQVFIVFPFQMDLGSHSRSLHFLLPSDQDMFLGDKLMFDPLSLNDFPEILACDGSITVRVVEKSISGK